MMENPTCGVVALACSAGGLRPVRDILSALPRGFPVPIVIAQHRGDSCAEALVRLLAGKTTLRVKTVGAFEALRPATVYVCPPGKHVEIANEWMLHCWSGPRISFVRPSCDLLFKSVADSFGARGVCVVLSGCGADGAFATRHVRRAGGYVIAQDEGSATFSDMPIAAAELGRVDLVLQPADIAFALCYLAGVAPGSAIDATGN